MKPRLHEMGFYFCTDRGLARKSDPEVAAEAVAAGAGIVQYREKGLDARRMYATALELRRITARGGALLIINDRVDLALAVEADGVHLGRDDLPIDAARRLLGPDRIIGATAHRVEEALEAHALGADYLGVSPIFATATKPDAGPPAGLELIRRVRAACPLPMVAIGGVNLDNIASVLEAGAHSACAISAVLDHDRVGDRVKLFMEFWNR